MEFVLAGTLKPSSFIHLSSTFFYYSRISFFSTSILFYLLFFGFECFLMFGRYSKYASKLQVKSDRFPNLYLDGELWYFPSIFISLFSMFIFVYSFYF